MPLGVLRAEVVAKADSLQCTASFNDAVQTRVVMRAHMRVGPASWDEAVVQASQGPPLAEPLAAAAAGSRQRRVLPPQVRSNCCGAATERRCSLSPDASIPLYANGCHAPTKVTCLSVTRLSVVTSTTAHRRSRRLQAVCQTADKVRSQRHLTAAGRE